MLFRSMPSTRDAETDVLPFAGSRLVPLTRSRSRALRRLVCTSRFILLSLSGTATAVSLAAPPSTCVPPIAATNTQAAVANVGTGTPQSCTEAALRSAILDASVVKFDCGSGPVTIALSSTIAVPTDRNIVIDGGGKITLDGEIGRAHV